MLLNSKKQAQGQLTLQTQSQPRAVFPVPLKKAKVSSEDDLLTTPPEDFHKLIEYVSTRVPEAVDEFKKFETHVQPLITKIVKSYTKEAINSELSRFEQDIQVSIQGNFLTFRIAFPFSMVPPCLQLFGIRVCLFGIATNRLGTSYPLICSFQQHLTNLLYIQYVDNRFST